MVDDAFTTGKTASADEIVQAELVGTEWRRGSNKVQPLDNLDNKVGRRPNEPFGVPSRFGIGTLLVVTAAYGAFLALLRACGFDRSAIAWVVVFISLVGMSQMLLFGARRPRQASLLAGAICLPAMLTLAGYLYAGGRRPSLAFVLLPAFLFGIPAGYLAGGIVAGVFLVMDAVQRAITSLFPAKGRKKPAEREDSGP